MFFHALFSADYLPWEYTKNEVHYEEGSKNHHGDEVYKLPAVTLNKNHHGDEVYKLPAVTLNKNHHGDEVYKPVLRIRLDPVFLGHPDPDPLSQKDPCNLKFLVINLSKIQFRQSIFKA